MTNRHTIIIFTERFPWGTVSENTFMRAELKGACQEFERVIIVPSVKRFDIEPVGLPSNVEVELGWINSMQGRSAWARMWRLCKPSTIWRAKGDMSRRGITMSLFADAAAAWLRDWIKRNPELRQAVFYTFWFDIMAAAMAVAMKNMQLYWVSSAHGFDIYTHRGGKLREMMLERVRKVYCASASGAEYMRGQYPDYAHKVAQRTLGADAKEGELSAHHVAADRKLTLLSVANVIDIKRVWLNARLLKALAVARPGTQIHWIHVGDGPDMPRLMQELAPDTLPSNFTYSLRGALPNEAVGEIYRTETIDWSMLLSKYEGGQPIAVAESLAHGVPVIANDTTGLAEIVTDDCGLVLPQDVANEEFVRGIAPYIDSDVRMQRLRDAAYLRWREMYNAAQLRKDFFRML